MEAREEARWRGTQGGTRREAYQEACGEVCEEGIGYRPMDGEAYEGTGRGRGMGGCEGQPGRIAWNTT